MSEEKPNPVDAGTVKPEGEQNKDTITITRKDFEDLKNRRDKAIEDRNKLTAEMEKAEAERLKATQKWEEAYNKEVPALKTELDSYKSKWTAYEEKVKARVEDAKSKITADVAIEYEKFISKLPLEDQDEWLSNQVGRTPKESPANGRAGTAAGLAKPVKTMTYAEKMEAYRNNPQAFAKSV